MTEGNFKLLGLVCLVCILAFFLLYLFGPAVKIVL